MSRKKAAAKTRSGAQNGQPLVFDQFSVPAQCIIGLIGSIALLQKWIARLDEKASDVLTWSSFIVDAQDAPTFKSQEEDVTLDRYFTIINDAADKKLDGRNEGTIKRIGDLIVTIIDRCQSTGSLSFDNSSHPDSAEIQRLADRLVSFADAHRRYKPKKNRAEIKESHLGDLIMGVLSRSKDRALLGFIEAIYGKSELPHPDFPSLRMFDLASLRAEMLGLHGMEEEQGLHGGIFAIVREARGWSEGDHHAGNLIVRDILWLLPQEVDDNEPARKAGIYVSATDKASFVVDRIMPEENMLHLVGHMENAEGVTQRMKLILTKFDYGHELEHRFGVLTGVTPSDDGQVLGSWKVVAVRPGWDTRVLSCLVAQFYLTDLDLCTQLIAETLASGVLYSNFMKDQRIEFYSRRIALRSLLRNDPKSEERLSTQLGGYLRSRFEDEIKPHIRFLHSMPPVEGTLDEHIENQTRNILDTVGGILLKNWIFVNPAQFSIHKKNKATRSVADIDSETKNWLIELLSKDHVYPSVEMA